MFGYHRSPCWDSLSFFFIVERYSVITITCRSFTRYFFFRGKTKVMIQNITRRAADVHVLYALLVTSAIPIDPQMASAVLSGDDGQTTRDLSTVCPYDASQADVMRLCQSVVTRAERTHPPYIGREMVRVVTVTLSRLSFYGPLRSQRGCRGFQFRRPFLDPYRIRVWRCPGPYRPGHHRRLHPKSE